MDADLYCSAEGDTMHSERPQLDSLTGLRFIAAAHVFLFHMGAGAAERAGAPDAFVAFLKNGYFGVSLFFILSGFILTYTYRVNIGGLGSYALARFARIYPVYVLALLMMLPLVIDKLDLAGALTVLLMIQTWTVPSSSAGTNWVMQAWTLSVELAFYIAFPFLLWLIRSWSARMLQVAAVVAAAAILALGSPALDPGSTHDVPNWAQEIGLPLLRMPEFFLGMVVCRLYLIAPPRANKGGVITGAVGAALLVMLSMFQSPHVLGGASVVTAGLIYCLAAFPRTRVSNLLGAKTMVLLGGASYALYLFQGPVREWVRVLLPGGFGQAINPVLVLTLSVVVFLLVEKPLRRKILAGRGSTAASKYSIRTSPTVDGSGDRKIVAIDRPSPLSDQ